MATFKKDGFSFPKSPRDFLFIFPDSEATFEMLPRIMRPVDADILLINEVAVAVKLKLEQRI